jgi:integrase
MRAGKLSIRRWTAREYSREDRTAALSEHVFHAGDGQAIVDFKHSWATACKRAGLPGRLFHDLRRTAVRDMIRAGVPQSVAMRISGHRTTAIFLRYDIASEADKRDALRRTQAHRATQTTTPTVVPMASASRAK